MSETNVVAKPDARDDAALLPPVDVIEDASGIRAETLLGAVRVGVTAGASAPEILVDGVVARLRELGARVLVEDHGPGALEPDNLGVTALEVDAARLAPDLPFEV